MFKKKDIYESKEWKESDALNRACILLVSEGVKPGSTFGSRYRSNVETILQKLRQPYLPPMWHKYGYTYTVAKDDKTLSDYMRKILATNLTVRQAHRAHGFFYGFPECCIDKYVGAILENPKKFQETSKLDFDDLLKEYERLRGGYPDELNYRIPGMVPCKAECENALKVLRTYKDVLLRYDNEAAEELKLFNKRGYRIINKSRG